MQYGSTFFELIKTAFDKEKIKTFEKEFKKTSHETLNDWKKALPNEFEFNEIRLLLNHFSYKKEDRKQMEDGSK